MLAVSPITNVKNTINNISFKAGVKVNAGANVINTTNPKKEGSFVAKFGFLTQKTIVKTDKNRSI